MKPTTSTTVSTKVTKDAPAPIETALTIDWEGVSTDDLQAMAQQALIVKWQGQARTNGIPTSCTIKAVDYRPGTRVAKKPADIATLLANLSPAERKALLEKFAD